MHSMPTSEKETKRSLVFVAENNLLLTHVVAALIVGIIDQSVRPPTFALTSAMRTLKENSVIDGALADQLIIALASSTESAWKQLKN